jgi:hypothetical protein
MGGQGRADRLPTFREPRDFPTGLALANSGAIANHDARLWPRDIGFLGMSLMLSFPLLHGGSEA